jgi:hypothetical protein
MRAEKWFPIVNTVAETIPSGGLARVTGFDADGNCEVAKPDADDDANLAVVSVLAVPEDGGGEATYDNHVIVAYEEADGTPAVGEEWGPASGSWKLRSGKTGFYILGNAGHGLVNAVRTRTPGASAVSAWKEPVRAATTAAGTLATDFENGDAIDGVTLATGDRILVKNQASATENGIYVVNASGAPTRASDADAGSELLGAVVFVSEGTTNKDTVWACTTNATITVGVTNLAWARLAPGVAVQEEDGTPAGTFTTIKFPNSTLTDNGDGSVSVRPVKVSADDTTSGFLNGKLVAGAGVTFTENSPGGAETLTIAFSGVTSVAMTVPSFLSVSGSPITTTGTLAVSLATQSANLVFAGPSSGAAAAPTFRALHPNDMPAQSAIADLDPVPLDFDSDWSVAEAQVEGTCEDIKTKIGEILTALRNFRVIQTT